MVGEFSSTEFDATVFSSVAFRTIIVSRPTVVFRFIVVLVLDPSSERWSGHPSLELADKQHAQTRTFRDVRSVR